MIRINMYIYIIYFMVKLTVKEVDLRRILFGADGLFGNIILNLYNIINVRLTRKELII